MPSPIHGAARGSLFSGTRSSSVIASEAMATPVRAMAWRYFSRMAASRRFRFWLVQNSTCTPSRPMVLATSRAAGSQRRPSDQSQAPILNQREFASASKVRHGQPAAAKAAASTDRRSSCRRPILHPPLLMALSVKKRRGSAR